MANFISDLNFLEILIHLGCIRLTLFRLFRNKNKILKLSADLQSNQLSS